MGKVHPHINLGVGYVEIAQLPFDQALEIRANFASSSFQNIQTQDGFIKEVLEYSQYEYWFDFQYKSLERDLEF